jgi:3-oxoacyl-[acyl-carrier protein] reductase
MQFEDKRALVTGGSRGIGRAIAEALIGRGTATAITGRDADTLRSTAEAIGAVPIPGDVGNEDDAARTVRTALEELGGLDILVNNAGIGRGAPLVETTLEMFEEVHRTNVVGPLLMAREAAKHFVAQGSGNLVNISSTAGLKGFQRGTTYCASKFALKGMTECWREELRRHNVRVVLVNPSEVQTEWGGRKLDAVDPKKLVPEDIARAVVGVLEIDDRGFVPEFAVFATNPF